jgi:uncharacterized protein (DUF697 family)/uncharacterized tellurite resistance protein B-like protein
MDETASPFAHQERDAVAALCLMAAQADGLRDEERSRLAEVFEALGGVDTARLYQRVLLGRVDLDEAAGALTTPGLRSYAYEMAVGVCDADGHTSAAERAFLDRLSDRLGLAAPEADAVREEAEALADAPHEATQAPAPTRDASRSPSTTPAVTPSDAPTAPRSDDSGAVRPDLERTILHRAILAGGLELLPQSLATMAIVPVQMKLVHEIGRAHGYTLDQGSVRELLAIAGVGLTSQVLEGYARKLFGKALRKAAGKTAGKVGRTATSALMTFATTYAAGKVADSYYGAGRRLDRQQLRDVFARELERGKGLFDRYQGEVRDRAATTNLSELTRQLRG